MKRFIKTALIVLLAILTTILGACSFFQKPSSASFQAMDTVMSLTVYSGEEGLCGDLQNRINRLDSLLDATDESSEIYRLNNENHTALSEDTARILRASLDLCDKLEDSFDVTVFPAVQAWGFTTGDYRVPDEEELAGLASRIDHTAVTQDGDTFSLPEGSMIDLGAVAKGYAADACTAILADSDALGAVLNLGGTICLYGRKPETERFNVGIADPDNPAAFFGIISGGACVISTSGGYERCFDLDGKRYIHILDPKTAAPVENEILSVTVRVRSDTDSLAGTRADALSTALFVMGIEHATDYYLQNRDFDFIILTRENRLFITSGIFDDFTVSDGYAFTLYKI